MNQILKELRESCQNDEKSKIRKIKEFKPTPISSGLDPLDFYSEKIHIIEKGVHREIILFIYKNQMHFMFLEKAISFVNAVDILTEIEEINYCNMQYEKEPKFQFLAIKLTKEA